MKIIYTLTNNGHNVSKHVVLANMIDKGKMEESWSLDLTSVRFGGSIRDKIHSKLSLWCFNSSVGSSSRDLQGSDKIQQYVCSYSLQ